MRAANSVVTLISAVVIATVITVSFFGHLNAVESSPKTNATAMHSHDAATADFSAEAAQLVVSRA